MLLIILKNNVLDSCDDFKSIEITLFGLITTSKVLSILELGALARFWS